MLNITTLILGSLQTNGYVLADTETKDAVVIDPAWDGKRIYEVAEQNGWQTKQIWLTHAHFDHIGGIAELCRCLASLPRIALHEDDLALWKTQGGAPLFGLHIDAGPQPDFKLFHGQKLLLGEYEFEVRHAPGHTPGHVVFYCESEAVMFCGDVIFQGSIGRADLPGGDYSLLLDSIQTQILTLPDETRLFTGHGPATTIGEERLYNPFLS